ncbi:hypothetical protein F5887DRAFT_1192136 [Amanita rubescens]|nr:hypothetical protein F5887DRAFT_919989 [Amanita rubescens]KAF8345435.1 hypothetical protein F5887DRAFT_1192136 [Amanita rubescens]
MPVITRSRRAQQEAARCLSTIQIPANGYDMSRLSDGTILQVTTSDTGEGKHWRWTYSETAPKSNPSLLEGTLATEESSQCDNIVTPVSSMPFLPPSIHAPRRREKHHSKPANAHRLVRPPLAPDSTIPWGMDLDKALRDSPTARFGHQAVGPHGTWLVDDEGEYMVTPTSGSSALALQHFSQSQEGAINKSTTSKGVNDEALD